MPVRDPRERPALVLFGLLLLIHLAVALVGWGSTGLPHNGFRETQTAISAHFIQQDRDFSLAYPTPVLGPPWSIPMEFPLYQWTTVLVSDLTGLGLPMAGRVVGVICFYLTLPALAGMMVLAGLVRWQRFVLLAAVVSCPLYLFYARAFLIETMALMFGAWFLWAYVQTGERREPRWLALALAAGVLGVLVKVTTFLFFLLPAAAWTLVWIARDLRGGEGWPQVLRRAAWCAPTVLVPLAVGVLWIRFADGVKAASFAGSFLQSSNLRDFNFGFGRRFEADIWRQHRDIWFTDILPWPLLAGWTGLAVLVGRRWWRELLVLLGCFFAVQVIFPLLYAFHAYYYVANAWTVMLALGLVAVGLLHSRLPRPLAWVVVAGLLLGQAGYAVAHYWSSLTEKKPYNHELVTALRAATAPDDVLIVAGDDWSSVIPYNAARRSLMLRTGVEDDPAYLDRAFSELKDYHVGALVVKGNQRFNAALIARVRDQLKIDAVTAFSWFDTDVYLAQDRRSEFVRDLLQGFELPEIDVKQWQHGLLGREVPFSAVPPRYEWVFAGINPLPEAYVTDAPLARYEQEGRSYFDAQPPKRLVFGLPAGAHTFQAEIGILPGAYEDSIPHGDRTDGIQVIVTEERDGIAPRVLFTQDINPRDRYDQRGLLKLKQAFTLEADSKVVVTITPGPRNNAARDWTIMGPLSFR